MMLIFHCFLQKAMKIFRKLWELGSDDLKFCIPNLSYHKKGALKKSATITVKCALKILEGSFSQTNTCNETLDYLSIKVGAKLVVKLGFNWPPSAQSSSD